jgi:flagellar export protein FliJ
MRKFKFTLQTVHKVRELKNEREKLTLSELQNEAAQADSRVEHIEAMRSEAVENYLGRVNSGKHLNALEMELSARHFASLNFLQKDAQKTADEKRLDCARQLEKVQAATVDVKVTDKLRHDQQRRHRFEADRQEQMNVDEIVSTKFARIIQGSK